MGFDRARTKSFGEPTRVRTDGTRAESSDDAPKRPEPSSYEKYKQSLHAFFNGDKPLPDHLKDMLLTRPGAEGVFGEEAEAASMAEVEAQDRAKGKKKPTPDDRKEDKKVRRVVPSNGADLFTLVEAIRKGNSPREVEAAVDALRAKGHPLPKDADILSKALGHSSEDVLQEALAGLIEIDVANIKSPQLLKTRTKNVALMASSSSLRELCGQLITRLG
jgi:hypothetical protein